MSLTVIPTTSTCILFDYSSNFFVHIISVPFADLKYMHKGMWYGMLVSQKIILSCPSPLSFYLHPSAATTAWVFLNHRVVFDNCRTANKWDLLCKVSFTQYIMFMKFIMLSCVSALHSFLSVNSILLNQCISLFVNTPTDGYTLLLVFCY